MTTATLPELDSLHLDGGGHRTPEDGVCLLEAVAYFAGEDHSESPHCASPVLIEMGIILNDELKDFDRQRLKPYIPHIIGTRDDGLDAERGLRCANWLLGFARTCVAGRPRNAVTDFINGLPAWVSAEELYPNIAAQLDNLTSDGITAGDNTVHQTIWMSVMYGFEVSNLLTRTQSSMFCRGIEEVISGPSDWTTSEIKAVQDNLIQFYGELVMLGKG